MIKKTLGILIALFCSTGWAADIRACSSALLAVNERAFLTSQSAPDGFEYSKISMPGTKDIEEACKGFEPYFFGFGVKKQSKSKGWVIGLKDVDEGECRAVARVLLPAMGKTMAAVEFEGKRTDSAEDLACSGVGKKGGKKGVSFMMEADDKPDLNLQ